MKRRIAAILVADIVGYSSLMESDEDGTAERLANCRSLVDAEIVKCEGRLFKAMGDAVLVEFASPINAVRCAVNIRAALTLAGQDEAQPLRMRFGLHLADVLLVENDDLIGDGVNLAARIQQAAEPDAIDVSAALFEQIRRNSPFAFDDRGEQSFRNISEPVRVYRVRGEITRHIYQVAPTQPAPKQAKRPHSIAVMPIETNAGDEDRKYLAEGVTEELIFELGRFKKLFVTSRSATRALSAELDPQAVGERLGVRYVLGGSIRQLGGQIRLSLSLTETDDGGVVWSDRVNESIEGLVDRLDELVSRIASTVLGRIEENDIALARRLKPESMTAYEFHLRGLEFHRLGGVLDENLREATNWFERAIEADPNFSRPRAMWVCARSGLPNFDWEDGERRTQRALELDPNDPEANRVMGSILMHRGAFDASRKYHEKAMELSPSDAYIKGRSAAFYNYSGEPDRALQLLDEAGELDPFLHVWCIEERVATLYNLGRYREAIEAALQLTFQTRRSRLYCAAAHAALGESGRAREIIAEALAAAPDLTAELVEYHECYRDPAVKRTLIEVLVAAGLPGCAAVRANS